MSSKADKKNFFKNTVALVIIQVLSYILPFITLPYLSRILEVDKLGLIFFAQILIDYFMRFTMFGFEYSGTRSIAINRDNFEKIELIFNSIFLIEVFLGILSFLILSMLIFFVDKFRPDAIVYYFTFLSVIGSIFIFGWFYQGMERMKFITISYIITKVAGLILIFCFVKRPGDYYLVPLFNSFGTVLAGGISIFFVKKLFKIKFYIPDIVYVIDMFKYSSQFFYTKLAIAVYRQTNAFVLGLVVTTTAVAYYVSADKILWALIAVFNPLNGALFPYMSKNKDIVFYKKILKYCLVAILFLTIFLFIASKHIIIIFFSEKMLHAVGILKILSFSLIFYTFVDILGFPLLGAFGYVKETNACYILGGIYNFVGLLLLFLLGKINLYSVSILVLSTYIAMFIHRIYYIHKYKLLAKQENEIS